jgi:hypothetical protein
MNLTLSELDYKTAIESLDSVETGNDLIAQLDFLLTKLSEEFQECAVSEPST